MQGYKEISHTFEPVYDANSKILILGSLPSVKSREYGFYYGHPRNRFWQVIAGIYGEEVPETVEEKKQLLLAKQIAIWDVIKSCEIIGSSDASIRRVVPMDIDFILRQCNIEVIFANGATAAKLFRKYCKEVLERDIIELPSTSPANAAYSLEKLMERWNCILI